MGGKGSGKKGELIPEHELFRLDILVLGDGGVFGDRVAGGKITSPSFGVTFTFTQHGNGLLIESPFRQLLNTLMRTTPSGGQYQLFQCPRCGAARRILYLVSAIDSFGCRGCLPLTYEIRNSYGSPARAARARVRSLQRGRRRPTGGQKAHEKRLEMAELEVAARERDWSRRAWEWTFGGRDRR